VIEDGDPSVDWATQILDAAGWEVLELVMWVTNTHWDVKPKRHIRQEWECRRLSQAPVNAKILKLADRLANLRDWDDLDAGFRSLYLNETKQLLLVTMHGDHRIHHEISKIVSRRQVLR